MCDDISVQEIGKAQYLVSQENLYSFRIAIQDGKTYISIKDIAECCGYRAASKVAQFATVEKVKITTWSGKTSARPNRCFEMWYMSLSDAKDFVRERSMRDGFRRWFNDYADKLETMAITAETVSSQVRTQYNTPSVQEKHKASAAQPFIGVNISPELIDRIIVDLLLLKQLMTSA